MANLTWNITLTHGLISESIQSFMSKDYQRAVPFSFIDMDFMH